MLFILILITSCTKIVDIIFPKHEPQLVVNCIFTTHKVITVKVNKSVGYNDTIMPIYVENLAIELYCNDTFVEILNDLGNGIYVSSIYPEEDKKYKIKIIRKNQDTVIAESYIPKLPEFTAFDTTHFIYYDPQEEYNFTLGLLKINDDEQSNNYYSFKLKIRYEDEQYSYSNRDIYDYKYTDERLSSEIDKYFCNFLFFQINILMVKMLH